MRRTVMILASVVAFTILYFFIGNYRDVPIANEGSDDSPDTSPEVRKEVSGCIPMSDTEMATVSGRSLSDGLSNLLRTAILIDPDLKLDKDKESILDFLDQIDVLQADVEVNKLKFDQIERKLTVDSLTFHNLRPAGSSCEESFGSVSIGGIHYDVKVETKEPEQ